MFQSRSEGNIHSGDLVNLAKDQKLDLKNIQDALIKKTWNLTTEFIQTVNKIIPRAVEMTPENESKIFDRAYYLFLWAYGKEGLEKKESIRRQRERRNSPYLIHHALPHLVIHETYFSSPFVKNLEILVENLKKTEPGQLARQELMRLTADILTFFPDKEKPEESVKKLYGTVLPQIIKIASESKGELQVITFDSKLQPAEVEKQKEGLIRYAFTCLKDPEQQSFLFKQIFKAELDYYAKKPGFVRLSESEEMDAKQESEDKPSPEQIRNVRKWVKLNLLRIKNDLLREAFIDVFCQGYEKKLTSLGLEQVIHLKKNSNTPLIQLFIDVQDSNEEAKVLEFINALVTAQKKEPPILFITDLAKTLLTQRIIEERERKEATWQKSAYDSIRSLVSSSVFSPDERNWQLDSVKWLLTELGIEHHLKKISSLLQGNKATLTLPLNLNKELNNINLTLEHYLVPPIRDLDKRQAMPFARLIGKIAEISHLLPVSTFQGAVDTLNINNEYLKQITTRFPKDSADLEILAAAMTSEITRMDGCDSLIDFAIKELKSDDLQACQKEMINAALLRKVNLYSHNKYTTDKLLEECNLYSSNPTVKQAFIRVLLQHEILQFNTEQFQLLALQLDTQSMTDVITNYEKQNKENERILWLQSIQHWIKTRTLAEYLHRPKEEQNITDLVTHLIHFDMEERKHDKQVDKLLAQLKKKAVAAIREKIDTKKDIDALSSIDGMAGSLIEMANDPQKQKECIHRIQLIFDVVQPRLEELREYRTPSGRTHTGEIQDTLRKNNVALATVLKAFYKKGNEEYKERSDHNYSVLKEIIETASPLGRKNLLEIALNNLEENSNSQVQFLYELSLHHLKSISSIEEAYHLIHREENKLIKNALCHAILAHEKACDLSYLQLGEIVEYINPDTLKKIQEKNPGIAQFLMDYNDKYFREALKIARQLASSEQPDFKVLGELSEKKLSSQFKQFADKNFLEIVSKKLSDFLPHIAGYLKKESARIVDDKNGNEMGGRKEAAKMALERKDAPPPGFTDARLVQLHRIQLAEVQRLVDSHTNYLLATQNIIDLLFTVMDSKENNFSVIIDNMLAHSDIRFLQMICTGYDPTTQKIKAHADLKNQAAKEFIINHLLHNHIKNVADPKSHQEMVDDLADSYLNLPALYQTFSCIADKRTKIALALAIFKNRGMRQWLLNKTTTEPYLAIAITITAALQSDPSPDLNDLFVNWTCDEFNQALLKAENNKREQAWIRCGMLSTASIVSELKENELYAHIKQINLHLLTPTQLMKLDKRVRIAYINQFKSWEVCKLILSNEEKPPAGNEKIRKNAEALTHDFNENDLNELELNEAALILSFKKQPNGVTNAIKKSELLKKTGLQILQELDHGGFLEEKANQELHDKIYATKKSRGSNCRHELVRASIYQADGSYPLKYNNLVAFDLKVNRNKFIKQASNTALLFAFSNIDFIRNGKDGLYHELKQIAERHFTAVELKKCIDQIRSQSEDNRHQLALKNLLGCLPAFLEKTTRFDKDNVKAMLDLYKKYKKAWPGQINKLKEALEKNTNNGVRQVLGPIIFSDESALKAHFEKIEREKNYQVPDFWLIRQLKFILKCMFAGMTFGAIWSGIKYFFSSFNPLNWISGSSSLQTGASYGVAVVAAIGAALIGIGISPVAAGLLAPIIMGAAGFIVGGLIVSTVWTGITTFGSFISRKWNEAIGNDTASESQKMMEIIQYGLHHNGALFLSLFKTDPDFRTSVNKTLSFCYDHGYDITEERFPDQMLRELLISKRDSYRYSERYGLTRFLLNLLAVPLFVVTLSISGLLFPPPFYVKRKADRLCEKIKIPDSSISKSDTDREEKRQSVSVPLDPEHSPERRFSVLMTNSNNNSARPDGYYDHKHSPSPLERKSELPSPTLLKTEHPETPKTLAKTRMAGGKG